MLKQKEKNEKSNTLKPKSAKIYTHSRGIKKREVKIYDIIIWGDLAIEKRKPKRGRKISPRFHVSFSFPFIFVTPTPAVASVCRKSHYLDGKIYRSH